MVVVVVAVVVVAVVVVVVSADAADDGGVVIGGKVISLVKILSGVGVDNVIDISGRDKPELQDIY